MQYLNNIIAPLQVCEWVNVGQQEEQNKIQAAWERNQTIARIQEAKPGFKSAKVSTVLNETYHFCPNNSVAMVTLIGVIFPLP